MRRGAQAAVAAAAAVLLLALAPPALIERFERLSGEIRNADRTQLWRESLALAADYPLSGCGLGAYETCFAPYKRSAPAYRDDFAHNDYLQLGAELGLPALAAALCAVGSLLRSGLRAALAEPSFERAVWAVAGLASLAALAVHSLFDFNLYVPANALAFAAVCGLLAAVGSPNPKESKEAEVAGR